MNENIKKEVLENHFAHFSFSLYNFKEKYLPVIFPDIEIKTNHVAYLCPLCITNYIVVTTEQIKFSSEFTIDHFPPQNVCGKGEILTCKTCNNNAGKYEAELERKMNYEAFSNNHPTSVIEKTTLNVENVKGFYKGFIKRNEDGTSTIDFRNISDKSTPYLKKWLNNEALGNEWSANLIIPVPQDKDILKALLKTAYLTCFVYWGYDFVFSNNAERIRNVLNDKGEYPIDTPSYWITEKINPTLFSQIPLGLCWIEKPIEMQTYVVNIPLKLNDYSVITSLLIPFSTKEGWDNLKDIESYQKNNQAIEVSFKMLEMSLLKNIFTGYSDAHLHLLKKE